MTGKVENIFITAKSAEPMQAVKSIVAVAGKGIEGDRKYRDGKGGKKDEPEREITLIEAEAVEAVNRDYPLRIEPIETRRNILTRDVALAHLVGKTFRVGPTLLRGIMLCEPCAHLQDMTRKGVMRALLHRGGLRAEIVEGGPITVGDAITPA